VSRHVLRRRLHRDPKEAVLAETETVPNEKTDTESETPEDCEANPADGAHHRAGLSWGRVLAYGVLPGLALILALGAGYLKWYDCAVRDSQSAGIQAVRAATDSTVAMLSYRPDTVERDLGAARDRLSGDLKDSYTALAPDVVIPGSRQRQISAVATVAAAAPVSVSATRAVVLVFVNQTVSMGGDPPTNTASRVRITLDRLDGRWLIAKFDPI
jgi:Mce-associated membrane protein